MSWLRRMFRKLWSRLRPKQFIRVRHVNELPPDMDPYFLYVVGQNGHHWHVAMICPCGCNAQLFMNLLPDEEPCWRLSARKDGAATLHPSVWRKVGCTSHFFLRAGKIQWCK